MVVPSVTRAWLLLVPLVPSIVVSLFTLYHLLRARTLRAALNNHVIILLLLCGLIDELIDIVSLIHFYFTGVVLSSTPEFCLFWVYVESAAFISTFLLMAWASIERHLLIFHRHWLRTRTNLIFLHYLPLTVCILWPVTFYFVCFFIMPCDISFDYHTSLCNRYWCIIDRPTMAFVDSVVHYIMPIFIVVGFSIGLLLRVLFHKYYALQRINWRNYKKLAGQLLPISALYLLLALPPMILYAAAAAGISSALTTDYFDDSSFFLYWVLLFTPFASIISLPELKRKCTKIFFFWHASRVVQPQTLIMGRLR